MSSKLIEKLKKEDKVFSFFLKLYESPQPPHHKDLAMGEIWWAFKVASAMLFFYLHGLNSDLIRFLTKYRPFSLLFQDRLFLHHKYKHYVELIHQLEEVARNTHIDMTILNGQGGDPYSEFLAYVEAKGKGKSEILKKLEVAFSENYGYILVRNTRGGIRLLVPAVDLESE